VVTGLDVVVRGRRGARKGLQWESVPKINTARAGHEGKAASFKSDSVPEPSSRISCNLDKWPTSDF